MMFVSDRALNMNNNNFHCPIILINFWKDQIERRLNLLNEFIFPLVIQLLITSTFRWNIHYSYDHE